jgi:hypothetical protein
MTEIDRSYVLALLALLAGCTRENAGYVAGQPCVPGAPDSSCGGGMVCDPEAQVCVCPPGTTLCGESCRDPGNDPASCGGCGLACAPGQSCAGGRCSGGKCAGGAVDCNGSCVDPKSNAQHCGGCAGAGGRRCGDGQACVAGACAGSPCPFAAALCGGACVDTRSSVTSCGGCNRPCPPGAFCVGGTCAGACAAGRTLCGGECVDLKHDPTHCGSCSARCGPHEVCASDDGKPKCREYWFAGCQGCPCPSCGERACCKVAKLGGYEVLCVEDRCPLP